MSNLTLVETVSREPLQFVLSPYDNHRLQFTLQVNDVDVFMLLACLSTGCPKKLQLHFR